MLKTLYRAKNSKKGFTLIELIIVIAILGILAAILVPSMIGIVNDSKKGVNDANARSIYTVAQSTYTAMKLSDTTFNADTYSSETDETTEPGKTFMEKVAKSLGGGFDEEYTITVDGDGVTKVTYGDSEDTETLDSVYTRLY